jgi:hypothetical protein
VNPSIAAPNAGRRRLAGRQSACCSHVSALERGRAESTRARHAREELKPARWRLLPNEKSGCAAQVERSCARCRVVTAIPALIIAFPLNGDDIWSGKAAQSGRRDAAHALGTTT